MQEVRSVSRADHEDAVVDEIMGQPRAYMELTDQYGTARVIYRTLVYLCESKDEAEAAMNDAVAAIHLELKKRFDVSMIIWRVRPSAEHRQDLEMMDSCWMARCRVATSPPLPEEVWEKLNADRALDLRKVAA
jgi:hypothetical protein